VGGKPHDACGVAFPAALLLLHADRVVLRRGLRLLSRNSIIIRSSLACKLREQLLTGTWRVRGFVLIVGLLRYRGSDDKQRRDNRFSMFFMAPIRYAKSGSIARPRR
jgi:hypothetical protein